MGALRLPDTAARRSSDGLAGNFQLSHRAAIYVRVSTDQQTTANQEPDCLRVAADQGWEVVQVYREQESAAKRRPVFDQVMRDARAGEFRHLIVWRLDRFGRRMQGNINDVLELDGEGVEVVSVKEPWLASGGPARNLLLAIFSWLAEEERRVLIERVKAGMERARKSGKRWGKEPASLVDIDAAARSVRGGIGIRDAARRHGVGAVRVRQVLAFAAMEQIRAGMSVRAASQEFRLGVDTLRRVLAGTCYLNRYPDRSRSSGAPIRATYLPFPAAREVARSLGLRSKSEWLVWCAGDGYRIDIPRAPGLFFGEAWAGWSDWLGFRPRPTFEEARASARTLGFRSQDEWRVWCREGKRPRGIPGDPRQAFPREFQGWPDWLGYEPRTCRGHMMPFSAARECVRKLGLGSAKEYQAWARTRERPRAIASNPPVTYSSEWAGWPDWLGYPVRKLMPFHTARQEVRTLGLRSRQEWATWARSSQRPKTIPSKPDLAYGAYWRGMPDWLGYRRVKRLSFLKARRYARRLGFRSSSQWQAWAKTPNRPRNVPWDPRKAYLPYWQGWRDWLGHT